MSTWTSHETYFNWPTKDPCKLRDGAIAERKQRNNLGVGLSGVLFWLEWQYIIYCPSWDSFESERGHYYLICMSTININWDCPCQTGTPSPSHWQTESTTRRRIRSQSFWGHNKPQNFTSFAFKPLADSANNVQAAKIARSESREKGYIAPSMCCMLSRSVMSNSFQPHGLQPTKLLYPWDFPGWNTGAGCHFLLLIPQGIFPTQRSNPHLPCLLYWQVFSLPLFHPGSPDITYMQNL